MAEAPGSFALGRQSAPAEAYGLYRMIQPECSVEELRELIWSGFPVILYYMESATPSKPLQGFSPIFTHGPGKIERETSRQTPSKRRSSKNCHPSQ